jgi:5-methylcytosine-specific restriction endonuclease McrA
MRQRGRRQLVLAIVATDATFVRKTYRDETFWVGRCIFCGRAITVSEAGEPGPDVTIEHILPRHHGGGDGVENLALACKPCNNEKGMRHDARRADDARTREVIARLQERRRERWREPVLR